LNIAYNNSAATTVHKTTYNCTNVLVISSAIFSF